MEAKAMRSLSVTPLARLSHASPMGGGGAAGPACCSSAASATASAAAASGVCGEGGKRVERKQGIPCHGEGKRYRGKGHTQRRRRTRAGAWRLRDERRSGMLSSACVDARRAFGAAFRFGFDFAGAAEGATAAAVPPRSPSCIMSLKEGQAG